MKPRPFAHEDLKRLIATEGGPHLSVFLPAPQSINNRTEDEIQIGNLTREAHQTLVNRWMPDAEADAFLKPLEQLAEDAELLNPRRYGIVVYRCDGLIEAYRADGNRREQLLIGRRFAFRWVLSSLQDLTSYHLLTLSENCVALYEGTRTTLRQIEPADWPVSFRQKQQSAVAVPAKQQHSAAVGASGKQGVVFHGQGGAADHQPTQLENYLKRLDAVVCSHLRDKLDTPLIVAGVEQLTHQYVSLSDHPMILEPSIRGNVDHMSEDRLLSELQPIVDAEVERRRESDANRIRERDCAVATDVEQILAAALDGRIDTLFIDDEAEMFGLFDPDRRILKRTQKPPSGEPDDESQDLLEIAAQNTINTSGVVHVVAHDEMPVNKPMAAGLRY